MYLQTVVTVTSLLSHSHIFLGKIIQRIYRSNLLGPMSLGIPLVFAKICELYNADRYALRRCGLLHLQS